MSGIADFLGLIDFAGAPIPRSIGPLMASPDPKSGNIGKGLNLCVAPNPEAAEAGAQMLRAGGNAFDAAAAAGFMEAVISPDNCGIGGYGATGIGYHASLGRLVGIDANTVAPARATPGMFPVAPARDPNDYRLLDSRHKFGPLSIAVPGVLGGLLLMLETWGRLPRNVVMQPAIDRAGAGVSLTPGQALSWLTMKAASENRPIPARADRAAVVPMPELAETLESIAKEGGAVFYEGRIGKAIADHVGAQGGILSTQDMAAYRALVVEPVTLSIRAHTLATPPPSSGGLSSLQMVALLDRFTRSRKGAAAGDAASLEATIEIAKVVWEDRLTRLADGKTMDVSPQTLLDDAHLDQLDARVLEGLKHPRPGRVVAPDPLRGTVHLAAADREGNLVAWTQTHGGGFGSKVMVPGTGVVLGHGMCRFEPRPGWANSIAPGKRPLHNMSPVIALKDGKPVLAVGCSGGRTIVNNSATVLIGRILFNLEPEAASAAPRVQCETQEPAVVERTAGAASIGHLRARGHDIKESNRDAGNAHLIARNGDEWLGVGEPRMKSATTSIA